MSRAPDGRDNHCDNCLSVYPDACYRHAAEEESQPDPWAENEMLREEIRRLKSLVVEPTPMDRFPSDIDVGEAKSPPLPRPSLAAKLIEVFLGIIGAAS